MVACDTCGGSEAATSMSAGQAEQQERRRNMQRWLYQMSYMLIPRFRLAPAAAVLPENGRIEFTTDNNQNQMLNQMCRALEGGENWVCTNSINPNP